jgi:hypothetical protein
MADRQIGTFRLNCSLIFFLRDNAVTNGERDQNPPEFGTRSQIRLYRQARALLKESIPVIKKIDFLK